MKKKRKKSTPYQLAKKKLWTIFARYIKLRDADEYSTTKKYKTLKGKCFTCDVERDWNQFDAGHFMVRGFMSTFTHEQNVHTQCQTCNMRSGEQHIYGIRLDEKYGEGTADELRALTRHTQKFAAYELDELREQFKEKMIPIMDKWKFSEELKKKLLKDY